MEAHFGGLLTHSGTDLQEAQLDGVEIGPGPLGASQAAVFDRVQQHVGDAVQEPPELVGGKAMAGGAVGVQEGLVIFDEAFHASAGTVEFLVQKLGRAVADIGDHEARVGLALGDLGFIDDAPLPAPAAGLIVEAGEQPHRLFGLLHQGFGLCAISGAPSCLSVLLTACPRMKSMP